MDIDIEHKEHIIKKELNIENIDIDIQRLEVNLKESSTKARELFTKIRKLKSCCKYSYTGISDNELDYIIEHLKKVRNDYRMTREELTKMCSVIRKYLENIKKTSYKKDVYKANIKNILELLKKNVTSIHKYKSESSESIGHLYNYQMDHIYQLKKDLQQDYENDKNCKEIRQVKTLIEKYYQVICEKLDYYTKELKKTGEHSTDHSKLLNKVYEYRLLYKRLILYIKHYKIVNKEKIVMCDDKSANLKDLYTFTEKTEEYLDYRIRHIYSFIQNAK